MAFATLSDRLEELRRCTAAHGVALIAREGHVIAHALPAGSDAETLAVLGATLIGAAGTGAALFGRRGPSVCVASGDDLTLFVLATAAQAILMVAIDGPAASVEQRAEILRAAALL